MPQNQFVVLDPVSGLYLTGYVPTSPASSSFGNLKQAIIFTTLLEAQQRAADIGGGTVGTTKPN